MYFSVLLSVLAVVFLGLSKVTQAAYCSGSPQPGERTNENAIFESDLSFLRSAKVAHLSDQAKCIVMIKSCIERKTVRGRPRWSKVSHFARLGLSL